MNHEKWDETLPDAERMMDLLEIKGVALTTYPASMDYTQIADSLEKEIFDMEYMTLNGVDYVSANVYPNGYRTDTAGGLDGGYTPKRVMMKSMFQGYSFNKQDLYSLFNGKSIYLEDVVNRATGTMGYEGHLFVDDGKGVFKNGPKEREGGLSHISEIMAKISLDFEDFEP